MPTATLDDAAVTVEPLKGFVTFERTISARQYEPVKASLMLQIPTDTSGWRNEDGSFNKQAMIADAKDTFFVAKAVIYEQLGIEYTVTPELVVQEILERALSAVEVSKDEAAAIAETRNVANVTQPTTQTREKLTGRAAWADLAANPSKWFDNRADKASGKVKSTNPDFKRKGSGETLWLTGRDGSSAVPADVDLSALGV